MDKLLVICGPTAVGKTGLAIDLAGQLGGEVVSADSRQVYRGMDIGTGKDKKEFGDIPVWMIDVVNPDEEFSVSHYVQGARRVIEGIKKRGRLPILVGGTGLYIQALLHPPDTIDIPPDRVLRTTLESLPLNQLQQKLRSLDVRMWDVMNTSDRHNPRRLIRKIEIAYHYLNNPSDPALRTKSPTRKETEKIQKDIQTDALLIGLQAPFGDLYRRIDQRVDERMKKGMVSEIQGLLKQGYSWDLSSMNTLGYKEWKNPSSQEDAVKRWKFSEHAYARRQMTWFRKMPGVIWFDCTVPDVGLHVTRKVASWYT